MSNPAGYLPVTGNGLPPIPKLRFTDPAKFDADVTAYFNSISIRTKISEESTDDAGNKIPAQYKIEWIDPPSMVNLGNFLDCDYRCFRHIEDEKYVGHPQWTENLSTQLRRTIARARQICHGYTYGSLFTAKSAQGPMFALKTVYKDHGYQEEININQSHTIDDKRLSLAQLSTGELDQLISIMDKAINHVIEDKARKTIQSDATDAIFSDATD